MPEDVDACAKSIMEDNPDMDESTAFAICQDMKNKGELEEGCPNVNLEGDCPEGHVMVNGECREIESVDAPPSVVSMSCVFQLAGVDTEPIERTEEGDNTVRYSNVKMLAPGM